MPEFIKLDKHGEPLYTKNQALMTERPLAKDLIKKAKESHCMKFSTQQEKLRSLDKTGQNFINAFKKLLNNRPSMLWIHPCNIPDPNGNVCEKLCRYNHWHVVWLSKIKLGNDSMWKTLKSTADKAHVIIKQFIVKYPTELVSHFMQPPRLFMGIRAEPKTDLEWMKLMSELIVKPKIVKDVTESVLGERDDEDCEPEGTCEEIDAEQWKAWGFNPVANPEVVSAEIEKPKVVLSFADILAGGSKRKLEDPDEPGPSKYSRSDLESIVTDGRSTMEKAMAKPSMTSIRIDKLVPLMKKHAVRSFRDLAVILLNEEDMDNLEFVQQCMKATNRPHLERTALELLDINVQTEKEPLIEIFKNFNLSEVIRERGCLRIAETCSVFLDWADEQNVDGYFFILTIYLLLKNRLNKKHCLILEGESNAGKTVMLDLFLFCKGVEGQVTTTSESFPFQGLTRSQYIRFDELFLTPKNVESFKKLFSGEPMMVAVKNKQDERIQGQPCFGSCNTSIFAAIDGKEQRAIENRCIFFKDLRQSSVLESLDGPLNPMFAQICYKRLSMMFNDSELFDIWETLNDNSSSKLSDSLKASLFLAYTTDKENE